MDASTRPEGAEPRGPVPSGPVGPSAEHPDAELARREAALTDGLPAPAADAPYRHGITRIPLDRLGTTHFVGIGGAGMSAVARVLAARGVPVTGSDAKDSASLESLREMGIDARAGHDAARLDGVDTLVVSSAIRADNPELMAARALGVPVLHRSMALDAATDGLDTLAVAGTHGKTTTTSMLAVMLDAAGDEPSFAAGGDVAGLGGNARFGAGRHFVLEADESDGSYVNYRPRVAIVTNIEPDHLDFYGSDEAVHRSFDTFVSLLGRESALVACADDEGSSALAERHRATAHVRTYGYSEDADIRITGTEPFGPGTRSVLAFSLDGQEAEQELVLTVPGQHNVLNAAGAFAAGLELGLDPERCAQGLAAFRGASRRFELKGEHEGVRVYDDYAHHPTEVRAAIAGARHGAEGRVLAVFQPHLYSRTEAFAREFAEALDAADLALVLPVYRAREDERDDITNRTITDFSSRGADERGGQLPVDSADDAVLRLADAARAGDVILTIGAGDVTELGPRILHALRLRGGR
ncbi:UDP-N-acetylmuramate--L-alanine ligase [Falsarthrobacter nasiphocae]|uniref:UDP-N-acetylmuramate--L-alanine ligase n=1 Tax=Falsarthrobacter nasiphocae TaxID=189863 RepID=A0AAE3YEN5_9MICC|nr:UDP-N-acetylmuramate--L-alanine ligase [Falsarthrobacter nasiphocae]MDR6891317.1 UDP-N-acetylmuramate--alanine ligase [Falsarthrobacter nasiphocae]